jgi:hypothetical protein
MLDLVKIARSRTQHLKLGTHWDGCEEHHFECLIQKMASEIERLRLMVWDGQMQHDEDVEKFRKFAQYIADQNVDNSDVPQDLVEAAIELLEEK